MKHVLTFSFLTLSCVLNSGCGGAHDYSAPPPQTGGDAETTEADPNAGVAFDEELMSKGAKGSN